MANKKISELNPSPTNYNYTQDSLAIVDNASSTTKRITPTVLFNNISGDIQASGIIKSNRINVNKGKLYVDNGVGNEFVKIGAYGTGSFFGAAGSNNGATYHLGVGAGGKIIESERVVTFQISGSGYLNLRDEPKILINSPGSGKAIFVEEVYFLQSFNSGDSANHATNASGRGAFATGTSVPNPFRISTMSSGTSGIAAASAFFPKEGIRSQDTFFMYKDSLPTDNFRKLFFNRPVMLDSPTGANSVNLTNINQVPGGSHFIKIKYTVFQSEADFRSISNLSVIGASGASGTFSLNAIS